jgi:hypothetical protein
LTGLESTVELIKISSIGIANFPSKAKLAAYIAGLVEGDGSIKIPSSIRSDKGKINYPSVTIIFVEKDLPLAKILTKILKGTLNKASGNWYVLSIYKLSALHEFAQLVNGKFRTPKIEALYRLINWLNNYGKFEQINALSADKSNIISNSWLAGFSDCDSNFLISFSTSNLGIAKNIRLTYRLSQRQEYHRASSTGISYLPIISTVATAFYTKFSSYERERLNTKTNSTYTEKGYLVTVSTLASRMALINYFLEFPLLSSKHLDYLNWIEAHKLVSSKQYRTVEGTAKLLELKSTMNNNRTSFNWDHLDSFV